MERLEHQDQVEGTAVRHARRVRCLERTVTPTAGGIRASVRDGRRVGVEPDHVALGIRAGHGDRRPAGATADVGHARWRRGETLVQVGRRGNPALDEIRQECRPVDAGLSLPECGAEAAAYGTPPPLR